MFAGILNWRKYVIHYCSCRTSVTERLILIVQDMILCVVYCLSGSWPVCWLVSFTTVCPVVGLLWYCFGLAPCGGNWFAGVWFWDNTSFVRALAWFITGVTLALTPWATCLAVYWSLVFLNRWFDRCHCILIGGGRQWQWMTWSRHPSTFLPFHHLIIWMECPINLVLSGAVSDPVAPFFTSLVGIYIVYC